MQIVREVFGKGNQFATKITYRTSDGKAEDLLQAFRNSMYPRIVVTVDMIATGTDVKPLECLLFMRSVKSRTYFEQMLGRGVRVIDDTEFQSVTDDAKRKDRFIVVDAVGVMDTPLAETVQPLERKPAQSLKNLFKQVAFGNKDPQVASSIAGRLARLDKHLTKDDRDMLTGLAGGTDLGTIARGLVDALDPDQQVAATVAAGQSADDQAAVAATATAMLTQALEPLATNPDLRNAILDVRKSYEQTIDEVSKDEVLFAGHSAGPGHPLDRDGPTPGHRRILRHREDEPDDPHLGRLVRRRQLTPPSTAGRGRCWSSWTAKADPTPGSRPPAPPTLLHAAGAATVSFWPDRRAVAVGPAAPRPGGHAVPDAGHRRRRTGRLLRRRYPGRPHAHCHRPRPPARQRGEFLPGSTRPGSNAAYAADWARLSAVRAAARHLPDIALRYRTLLDRLGPGFDGTAPLLRGRVVPDPGRHQPVLGRPAQALAITELLAHAATSLHAEPGRSCSPAMTTPPSRPRSPWQLYERGRSLGIGVQVSAQSWHGLGNTDDERYRIAATADGGIWLMSTPTRTSPSSPAPGGSSRPPPRSSTVMGRRRIREVQHALTADPGIARRLATGQAGYITAAAAPGSTSHARHCRPCPSRRPRSPSPRPARTAAVPPWPARSSREPHDEPAHCRPSHSRCRPCGPGPAQARSARPFRCPHGRRVRDGRGRVSFRGLAPPRLPSTMAGILIWLAFAARADVAPPPGR